ncbi:MAG: hypothetical protein V1780_05190 [Chloroflexota bacterium]
MNQARVREIERQIADLKASWLAHTVRPWMWQRLEELEAALEEAKAEGDGGSHAG